MSSELFSRLVVPDLAGKVVLVTGASSGIGAALVSAYAAQGCRVGLHFNANRDAASDVARQIAEKGGDVFLVQGDMSAGAEARRVVEATASHFGRLDGLVNNAGSMLGRVPYAELSDEHYDRVMDLNCRSLVQASRAVLPWLKRQGGFVISTSSVAARNGGGGGAGLYAAAKAFVSNYTRGLAKELVGDGIRVNAVAPGVILTPFHDRYSNEAQMAAMVSTIPMGRAASAEECVGAYLFLSSDLLAGYVTGQILEVNGGQLMP